MKKILSSLTTVIAISSSVQAGVYIPDDGYVENALIKIDGMTTTELFGEWYGGDGAAYVNTQKEYAEKADIKVVVETKWEIIEDITYNDVTQCR